MSSENVPSRPPVGWTSPRVRRAKLFSLLLVATAALAVWASYQPWYGFSTGGRVDCSQPAASWPHREVTIRMDMMGTQSKGVSAAGCITGQQIARIAESAAASPVASTIASMNSPLPSAREYVGPSSWLGMPRPVALVALGGLIGVVSLLFRNGWLGGAGLVGFYYAHGDLAAMQDAMSSGLGGSLNTAQQGLFLFGWALLAGWALTAAATLFVVKHNREQRKLARQAASAAGDVVPKGPLDHLAVFLGGKIAQGIDAARKQEQLARNEQ